MGKSPLDMFQRFHLCAFALVTQQLARLLQIEVQPKSPEVQFSRVPVTQDPICSLAFSKVPITFRYPVRCHCSA